jgi:hypothetical protein
VASWNSKLGHVFNEVAFNRRSYGEMRFVRLIENGIDEAEQRDGSHRRDTTRPPNPLRNSQFRTAYHSVKEMESHTTNGSSASTADSIQSILGGSSADRTLSVAGSSFAIVATTPDLKLQV